MSMAEALGRASAGAPVRKWWRSATRRTVEVRVVVSGVEEDALTASRADTLAQSMTPILRHLDGNSAVEMVGVERRASLLGSTERRQPLADLGEAMAFLGG